MPAFDDRLAVHAHHRHVDGRPLHRAVRQFVIERAGEDARGRGLADAAHAGEDPGLRNASGLERVRDRAHHGVLADQVVESRRPVFARQHAIAVGAAAARPVTELGNRAIVFRLAHRAIRFAAARRAGSLRTTSRNWWEADERPEPRSLGLLPSGPDPVGEWLVHRQPPASYIGPTDAESKPRRQACAPRLPRHLSPLPTEFGFTRVRQFKRPKSEISNFDWGGGIVIAMKVGHAMSALPPEADIRQHDWNVR